MIEKWIIPCNIRQFNVIEHFQTTDTVVWKNSFTMKPDDIAYIYIGAPFGEIKYKCIVTNTIVNDEMLKDNSYAIVTKQSNNYFSKKTKYVQLKLLESFPDNTFNLNFLKEHGLGQVQIQARVPRQLKPYLEKQL